MNVCYRHPNRETGVSCQRCDRYICPECSTPGAVGFLCPEDAKQKANIQRASFQQTLSQRAPITMVLLGINVFIFVANFFTGAINEELVYGNTGDGSYSTALRAFTSGFAHGDVMHIAFNMYSLFVLGALLEPFLGKLRFGILYLLGIFGGIVAVKLLSPYGTFVLGASGAIFALMGAFLVVLRSQRMDTTQLLILIGLNVVMSFLPGIAWEAHIGGLVTGMTVAGLFVLLRQKQEQVILYSALAVMGIAFVLLIGV